MATSYFETYIHIIYIQFGRASTGSFSIPLRPVAALSSYDDWRKPLVQGQGKRLDGNIAYINT